MMLALLIGVPLASGELSVAVANFSFLFATLGIAGLLCFPRTSLDLHFLGILLRHLEFLVWYGDSYIHSTFGRKVDV